MRRDPLSRGCSLIPGEQPFFGNLRNFLDFYLTPLR